MQNQQQYESEDNQQNRRSSSKKRAKVQAALDEVESSDFESNRENNEKDRPQKPQKQSKPSKTGNPKFQSNSQKINWKDSMQQQVAEKAVLKIQSLPPSQVQKLPSSSNHSKQPNHLHPQSPIIGDRNIKKVNIQDNQSCTSFDDNSSHQTDDEANHQAQDSKSRQDKIRQNLSETADQSRIMMLGLTGLIDEDSLEEEDEDSRKYGVEEEEKENGKRRKIKHKKSSQALQTSKSKEDVKQQVMKKQESLSRSQNELGIIAQQVAKRKKSRKDLKNQYSQKGIDSEESFSDMEFNSQSPSGLGESITKNPSGKDQKLIPLMLDHIKRGKSTDPHQLNIPQETFVKEYQDKKNMQVGSKTYTTERRKSKISSKHKTVSNSSKHQLGSSTNPYYMTFQPLKDSSHESDFIRHFKQQTSGDLTHKESKLCRESQVNLWGNAANNSGHQAPSSPQKFQKKATDERSNQNNNNINTSYKEGTGGFGGETQKSVCTSKRSINQQMSNPTFAAVAQNDKDRRRSMVQFLTSQGQEVKSNQHNSGDEKESQSLQMISQQQAPLNSQPVGVGGKRSSIVEKSNTRRTSMLNSSYNKISLDGAPEKIPFECRSFLIAISTTCISTLLDLIRVGFFDTTADTGFLVFTCILQAILLINIIVNVTLHRSIITYFFTMNGFAEMAFFICNFLSSGINKSDFMLFLVANYLKIINAVRVSEILSYLQKRWKAKLIRKYKKEREKLKSREKKFMKSSHQKRKSVDRSLTQKVGEMLREKYAIDQYHKQQSMFRRESVFSSAAAAQLYTSPLQPPQQRAASELKSSYNNLNDGAPINYRASVTSGNSQQRKVQQSSNHVMRENTKDLLQDRVKDYNGMNLNEQEAEKQNSQLESAYMQLIVFRTMIIFFLCVLTVPFFMDTFYYSRHEMLDENFNMLVLTFQKQNVSSLDPQAIIYQISSFINITQQFNSAPLISFESPYLNYTSSDIGIYRESDMYKFTTLGIEKFPPSFYINAVFSGKNHNNVQSILGFSAYVWYFILVFFIMLWIKRHIELQVVIPFNSLLEKIWSLIIDPMIVISTNEFQRIAGIYSMVRVKQQEHEREPKGVANMNGGQQKKKGSTFGSGGLQRKGKLEQGDVQSLKNTFENEIEMIDNSLFKISKLLMLCYGEAGATIVSKMINSDSAILDFSEERGSKVLAIFGFCDIRNFTDATEIFQESVISLVNQVASIVHQNTVRHGGQPNKNIGDAFLLVWRLSQNADSFNNLRPLGKTRKSGSIDSKQQLLDQESQREPPVDDTLVYQAQILVDLAVLSVLKIIANIHQSKELNVYNENPQMNKRIPGFKIKLGFGLHLGWAVEGMIGSNFKADASYLSPNVYKAARLEASTKYYGVQFLMSEQVQQLMSKPFRALTRVVDKVLLKGFKDNEAIDIFTIDMDFGSNSVLTTDQLKSSFLQQQQGTSGVGDRHESFASSTTGNGQGKNNGQQEDIRHEQKYLFESLYSGEQSTFQLMNSYQEVQQLLLHQTSPYYKAFKLQYYQAFCLYQAGMWEEALVEFNQCLQINPGDGPSLVLRDFSQEMLDQWKNSPDGKKPVWHGRREFDHK